MAKERSVRVLAIGETDLTCANLDLYGVWDYDFEKIETVRRNLGFTCRDPEGGFQDRRDTVTLAAIHYSPAAVCARRWQVARPRRPSRASLAGLPMADSRRPGFPRAQS